MGTEATPANIAVKVAARLFAERRGHGGASSVSYRQIGQNELAHIIESAIRLYAEFNPLNINAEMLAALREAADYIGTDLEGEDETNPWYELLNRCRAIIAKAGPQ